MMELLGLSNKICGLEVKNVGIGQVNNMDSDVLIVSYDRGYGNEIPILLVGRNTDKGMEIIKAFEREEANKVYELLSK